jgi:hypothetical protein
MIDNIERKLRHDCGIEATIHMDPIVTDDERVTLLRTRVEAAVQAVDPALRIHDFRFVEGTTHSNLIFDVALPQDLRGREKEFQMGLNGYLNQNSPMTYYTVITFDPAEFNSEV